MDCDGDHVGCDTGDMRNPVGTGVEVVYMVQFCNWQEHNENLNSMESAMHALSSMKHRRRCLTIPFGIVIQCSFVFQTDAQTCQPFQCEITVLHLTTVQYGVS